MDSETGITFGEMSTDSRSVSQVSHQTALMPLQAAQTEPPRASLLYMVMVTHVGLSTLGAAGMAIAAAAINIAFIIPALVMALPIPMTALLLPIIRRDLDASKQKQSHQHSVSQSMLTLLEHLQQADKSLTVSQIQKQLGWGEERTLEAVHELLSSQSIEEDLDIEEGHYLYRSAEQFQLEADATSASQRYLKTQRQLAITKQENT